MRTVSTAAAAVLAGKHLPLVLLIEMDLSTPLRLNTSGLALTINGLVYQGSAGVGRVGAIGETPAEVRGLQFELSSVPADRISLMLQEPVQGKAVRIKTAILDPSTYQVLDVRQRWSGFLDVISSSEQGDTATLSVAAEHAGIDLSRPATSLLTDAEQQRLYPGDVFLQYMADQVEQRVVWPAAEFFRK